MTKKQKKILNQNTKDTKTILTNKVTKELENIQLKNSNTNYIAYKANIKTINSMILTNTNTNIAIKELDHICKTQNKKGEIQLKNSTQYEKTQSLILLLQTITTMLKKNPTEQKTKKYIKNIQKTLNYIKEHFCDDYLLLYEKTNENKKLFKTIQNAKLLKTLEELSQQLNLSNHEKLNDEISRTKNKIELGLQRYCIYEKEDIILKEFDTNANFKLAQNSEKIQLKSILPHLNIKILHKKINENLKSYLNYLLYLKQKNKSLFDSQIKENTNILKHFPHEILTQKEFEQKKQITHSINKEHKLNYIEQKHQNKTIFLINPNSPQTINKIIYILKND